MKNLCRNIVSYTDIVGKERTLCIGRPTEQFSTNGCALLFFILFDHNIDYHTTIRAGYRYFENIMA